MANDVFANGREISCKKADGKSICAFPDVCMTPPQTPATPPGVPIPYPNTGFAKDTAKGSKKVKISNKEVMLKNKSHFKTSTGDEAGSAPKKGVITSKTKGKIYFKAWSMDVKFEGMNVVRHLDIATHNHASDPGQTPPWPYADSMAIDAAGDTDDPCAEDKRKQEEACEGKDPCPGRLSGPKRQDASWAAEASAEANADDCVKANRCMLVPYKPDRCCPGQTAHHVVPKSSFFKTSVKAGDKLTNYDLKKAPCICLEGTTNTHGDHGLAHTTHAYRGSEAEMEKGKLYPFSKEVSICAASAKDVAPNCDQKCLEAQLVEGHKQAGVDTDADPAIKHNPSGRTNAEAQQAAKAEAANRATASATGIP